MSTFVQKAEEVMTRKQPDGDSSSNYGSHNSDSDPSNKADTQVISDKENHGANFSRFSGDDNLDSVRHYGSNDTSGPHDSKVANKLDPRVDSSKDDKNIPGWMIA
ncbi:cell surface protein [Penicillium canescens]|uniref:Cell surface protein n=1 Tax=Penicillium canescens TaxID=5083 RepID=A0AAD6I624_PENCN|nr:cell surface protein [Penicillium canescens]KAJ5981345.1 cell surface protein [Penicillium canescens]KAJ6034437.1 cell surface protein [Penicillium canescens]KAJ6046096.1 cell surface protein [Penicillium canescens]KAJ6053175.1 cell surface protein [Penicillium canescens]KAJ6097267.1 cell surface protein [Penicillium canescens]